MKVFKILLIIAIIVIILAGGALFLANRYLQSPAFKETALAAARSALGAEVVLEDLTVSLFSGVSLRGIKVANPAGFEGNLVEAQAFTLQYRLWPLLRKQVVISQLILEDPTIRLARNQQGVWNYELIGGGASSSDTAAAPRSSTQKGGMEISLKQLGLANGTIEMRTEDDKLLVKVEDLDFSSAVTLTGNRLNGSGQASIQTLNLANAMFVREVNSPLSITPEEIKLAPLSGRLAGGAVGGEIVLHLTGGSQYGVKLQVTDGDVATLLQEAGTQAVMTGRLQLNANLTGTGGLPTIKGDGHAEIVDGQLMEIPLLTLLGTLLQIPELQQLTFSECRLEFTIADNQMPTPVIRVTAPKIQLTGNGTVSLNDYSLNHTLTLAVEKELLAKVPKEVRASFTEREDGYLTIEFKVTGPYDNPKTDLSQRLLKGATDQLLQKGLQKLLR